MSMHLERRVLISGGAGFLGSHLCERLLERGCQVLCVDNFFTGARHNIEHLLDHKRFELLRHDITHPLFVEVDEIFNLACPASPTHYQKDPVQTTKTSVIGAINMLGLAKRLKRFMETGAEIVGPINLGNPTEFTMRQLAELVLELTGSRSKIVHRPLPQDDPRQRRPDISEAERLLGWRPAISLREGLTKTIPYFEHLLAEKDVAEAVRL